MIDIVVTQHVIPGKEREFEILAKQLEANTLAHDKGCLRYEWYKTATPQTYILIERWTDQEAVQTHLKAGHIAEIGPKLQACVPERFTATMLTRLE